jgi:hypothetical protein
MPITAEQIYNQVQGSIKALEKLPAKEREQKPSQLFANNYNQLLALAKEAMPSTDTRRWPPEATVSTPTMGQASSQVRYTELHSFLEQISAIVAEGIEPPSFG